MKKFLNIILFPFKCIIRGLLFLSLLLSRGFYFYVVLFFRLLKRIFHFEFLDKCIYHFEKRKEQPEFVLVIILWCVAISALFNLLYVHDDQIVNLDSSVDVKDEVVEQLPGASKDSNKNSDKEENKSDGYNSPIVTETNPFRIYGKLSLDQVNFSELKKKNSDTVAWLSVDRTNINYPIVQTNNNDFYLDHTFDKTFKKTGWIFMDYRNSSDMIDDNTIFYGHNLINKTAFGSISNIFTDKWFKESNRVIVVLTENKKYMYKIFSAYYIEPEVYYLTTNFVAVGEKDKFLNTLKNRSIVKFNESISSTDKIITLSTCTEDNKGRKVIHAKLVSVNER